VKPRVLVLDNYVGELGAEPVVFRNDALTPEQVLAADPAAIIISPGPGTPADAGISVPLVRASAGRVPLLGVCLGHQAIGEAFGGKVVRAGRLMHGKTTRIVHGDGGLFEGIPSPLTVMRYHSLVVSAEDFPSQLERTAWSEDRPEGQEIMALRHRTLPIYGVQFHPESIATEQGKKLLVNFLELAYAYQNAGAALPA
jgi:anthranilate synthase component 2